MPISGPAATRTTVLTAAQTIQYERKFLSYFQYNLHLARHGQKATFNQGEGGTLDWFRYHPLNLVTSALSSEGQTGFTTTALRGMNIQASLEEWGNAISFSMKHYYTSRDRTLTKGAMTVAQQAAESIERYIYKTVIETGITGIHAGAINSAGTVSASKYVQDVNITGGSTTTLRLSDSQLGTFANKAESGSLVGAFITIQMGRGYGWCGRVTDYQSTGRQATVSPAIPETPQAYTASDVALSTKVHICQPFAPDAAVASGDKVTTEVLNKAYERLRKNKAPRFADGYFHVIIPTEVHTQLLSDSKWRDTAENAPEAADGGFQMGMVKVWSGMKFFETNMTPRFALPSSGSAGYQSFSLDTGHCFVTLCLGEDAFGVPLLEGAGTSDVLAPDLKIAIPHKNDNNPTVPLNTYGTMGWHIFWDTKALNANNAVAIFSYV